MSLANLIQIVSTIDLDLTVTNFIKEMAQRDSFRVEC
jgi:hypothetical protein